VVGIASASDLDVGDDFACVVTGDDVQCWGDGISGELGHGMLTRELAPVLTRCFP
jgi:hypothetical protein